MGIQLAEGKVCTYLQDYHQSIQNYESYIYRSLTPPSREDQDQGSLIDDEASSHIDEEDEQRRANNVVPLGEDTSPHGGGKGAIASIREALLSLQ